MERIKKCLNFLLFGLLSLFLCLFIFSQNTKVFAYTQPTMSQEQAQAILDFAIGLDNYVCLYDVNSLNSGDTSVKQQFQNMSATQVATAFNDMASQIAVNFTWDDVTIVIGKNYNSTFNPKINANIIFFINSKGLTSSNLGNNRTYPSVYASDNFNYIKQVTGDSVNYIRLYYSPYNNTIQKQKGTNLELKLYPKFTPELSQDELYITNMNYVLSINTSTKWQYNNTLYVIGDTILTFDNAGNVIGNEPIPDDTESSLGYYFYDSQQEGVKEINLLSLDSFQPLGEWWYIGNDLTFTYHYYYYDRNNNSVVFADNYVDIIQSSNSGDTGKFYFPRISRQHLEDLQNNTGYYLTLYIGSGDIILANDFYSFVTYSSVVDSGATGTITNSSGDVTGNVDLTGVQAGINDVNETLTNVPDISNVSISSGDVYNSLGFQIASDPYANFWYEFTQSLGQALTTSTKSYLDINYLGYTYRWDLTNTHNPLPVDFQHFLQGITTCFMIYYLTKQIRILVNDLQSGGILSTAHGAVVGDDTFIAYF